MSQYSYDNDASMQKDQPENAPETGKQSTARKTEKYTPRTRSDNAADPTGGKASTAGGATLNSDEGGPLHNGDTPG